MRIPLSAAASTSESYWLNRYWICAGLRRAVYTEGDMVYAHSMLTRIRVTPSERA
jgi:hypothetical protein